MPPSSETPIDDAQTNSKPREPLNTVTGHEGEEFRTYESLNEDDKKALSFALPKPIWEVNWHKAFNEQEKPVVFERRGTGQKSMKVAKLPKGIYFQMPECDFPFGVDFGKEKWDKPYLTVEFKGPVGAMVCESYTRGDFYKALRAFVVNNVAELSPGNEELLQDGADAELSDKIFRSLFLSKNTCAPKEFGGSKQINMKFYCFKNDLKATIYKPDSNDSTKQISVPINEIKPGSKGIIYGRLTELPNKDNKVSTPFEIMKVLVTGMSDAGPKNEVNKEILGTTSMIDVSAEQKLLDKLALEEAQAQTQTQAQDVPEMQEGQDTSPQIPSITSTTTKKTARKTESAAPKASKKQKVSSDGF
jgi:hypothetical protein